MSCSVCICALRSHYSALNSIPIHCLLLYESNVLIASYRLMTKFVICRMDSLAITPIRLVANLTNKNCAYRDSNSDCLSRARRSADLSIPGRDTYYKLCRAVYLFMHCAHIALSIPFHYTGLSYTIVRSSI